MLTRDPSARATATEVLNHEWVKEDGVAGDVEIEPEVRRHLVVLCTCQTMIAPLHHALICSQLLRILVRCAHVLGVRFKQPPVQH